MSVPENETQPLHVFLVDDDPAIHETIRIACDMAGIKVTSFDSGAGLVQQFAVEKPDIVMLDYGLAATVGTDLARQLRAHCGDEPVRLILLTGYRSDAVAAAASAAGIQEVIYKPVSLAELIDRLRPS